METRSRSTGGNRSKVSRKRRAAWRNGGRGGSASTKLHADARAGLHVAIGDARGGACSLAHVEERITITELSYLQVEKQGMTCIVIQGISEET